MPGSVTELRYSVSGTVLVILMGLWRGSVSGAALVIFMGLCGGVQRYRKSFDQGVELEAGSTVERHLYLVFGKRPVCVLSMG